MILDVPLEVLHNINLSQYFKVISFSFHQLSTRVRRTFISALILNFDVL